MGLVENIASIVMKLLGEVVPYLMIAAMISGCRKEDWREVALDVPGLVSEEARTNIVAALSRYGGVDRNALEFDFASKTVKVKYDSMQVAKMNLIMAIHEKGVEIVYPGIETKSGKAGYINER